MQVNESDSNNSYWEQLQKLSRDIPGWTPAEELFALFTLAISTSRLEGDILELGSWCGRSTNVLAMAAKIIDTPTIYAVDLFPEKDDWYKNDDGTYSFTVDIDGVKFNAYNEQTVWEYPFLNEVLPVYEKFGSILSAFNSTVLKYSNSSIVKCYKGDLRLFRSQAPSNLKLRFAFIDGDHGYSAVKDDILLIDECLVSGGWICFDDAFTTYEGVNNAINDFIINNPRYDSGVQLTRKLFAARKL